VTLLLAGWRQSLAYGKVLVAGRSVHFELQASVQAAR